MATRNNTATPAQDVESPDVLPVDRWLLRGGIRVFVPAEPQAQEPRKRYKKHGKHGSVAGYRRHLAASEPSCDDCLTAMRAHWRKYKKRPRRGPLPLSPCGTYNAWRRHKRRGDEPCESCVEAAREYAREYRRKTRPAIREAA